MTLNSEGFYPYYIRCASCVKLMVGKLPPTLIQRTEQPAEYRPVVNGVVAFVYYIHTTRYPSLYYILISETDSVDCICESVGIISVLCGFGNEYDIRTALYLPPLRIGTGRTHREADGAVFMDEIILRQCMGSMSVIACRQHVPFYLDLKPKVVRIVGEVALYKIVSVHRCLETIITR